MYILVIYYLLLTHHKSYACGAQFFIPELQIVSDFTVLIFPTHFDLLHYFHSVCKHSHVNLEESFLPFVHALPNMHPDNKRTFLPLNPPQMSPPRRIRRHLSWIVLISLSAYLLFPTLCTIRSRLCSTSTPLLGFLKCDVPSLTSWNLFYHLGGNGPWIPKTNTVGYSDALLPKECRVDQVHMLSRHGERYPTRNAGARHLDLLGRLQNPDVALSGSLSFLDSWAYFTDPSDPAFENLTASGPYAGTLQAHKTGKLLRQRYDHLIPKNRRTKFWSCGSERDIETALHFADGFFGPKWTSQHSAELEIIPETEDRAGNTLTPGDTCYKYVRDTVNGHDAGYTMLGEWQSRFTKPIAERLEKEASGMTFSMYDIYSMMEMCGFEILARGASPWCEVFPHQEWLDFEYARDILHFYRAGPGNMYAGAMGWLWLNATRGLMLNESSEDAYFSFVHDGDIVPVLATLQVLDEPLMQQELPTDHVKTNRHWRTSDVVPMGGRLVLERIACETTKTNKAVKDHFVRLFINDGLVKLPGIPSVRDVQHAVRLEDFQDFIGSREEVFGDFRSVCSLSEDAPDRITFLHQ